MGVRRADRQFDLQSFPARVVVPGFVAMRRFACTPALLHLAVSSDGEVYPSKSSAKMTAGSLPMFLSSGSAQLFQYLPARSE